MVLSYTKICSTRVNQWSAHRVSVSLFYVSLHIRYLIEKEKYKKTGAILMCFTSVGIGRAEHIGGYLKKKKKLSEIIVYNMIRFKNDC